MSIRDILYGPNAATGSVSAPGASALGATRREAIPTGAYDPTDDLSFAAQESGVPLEHLRGHAGTESAGGRNMVNPRSSASGPLQVLEGTFADVNQRHFGGQLDWSQNRDKARAGARYYREQLDKYGGDRATALAAYFVGPGKADELLQSGGKEGLMNYSVPGQGRPITVRDYVSKTMGNYEERGSSGQPSSAIPERVDLNAPLPGRGGAGGPMDLRSVLYSDEPIDVPRTGGETELADFGKALAITGGDFVKAPVAALENLAGQLGGEGRTPTERSLIESQKDLAGGRRSIGEWQKSFFDSMTPEAIDRAQRELLTLDPNKTIWQGGAKEFMSSLALKGTLSLGPTIGPMVTTAILGRLGVGASASTLWGAQEGLMSAGLTAAQIADDIEQTPLDELRKIERFKALEAQVGEAEARRQFVNEVQGVVPAVTGLMVGSIAKAVGKPLDKIFGTGAGLPFGGRVAAGATVEALQEGPQSFFETVMQNYAETAYKSNVDLFAGAGESAVQGMLLGGIMGGTFAGMFGNRPQNQPMSSDPVPQAIRDAIGAQSPSAPPAAAPQSAIPTEPPAAPAASTTPTLDEFAAQGQSWDPNAAPAEAPLPQLFGDNVGAEEVALPPINEQQAPFPKNKVKPPKLEWTDGVPDEVDRFAAQQNAAAARQQNPLGLAPEGFQNPVPTDVEAALGAVEQAQPWDPNAAPGPFELGEAPPEPAPLEANKTREPKLGLRPTEDGLKAIGGRTRTEQLGFRVRVRNEDGSLVSSQLVDGKATAKILAKQAEKKLQPGQFVELLPARRTFLNEQTPTAEPVSDVLAQIRSMQGLDALDLRMDSDQRRAVYITRETLDNLREAGALDQALSGGVPIKNFDTYGGVLLARDADTAQELMQLIEDPNSNIDEVIGYATGSGDGKPGGTNPVVQLLDPDGNVIRERQVTPEEAPALKAKWGTMARVMPLEQALAIRQNRMEREKAERMVAAEQQAFAATKPEQVVGDMLRENPITEEVAEDAEGLAKQGGFEEDIGGRLENLMLQTRAEEKSRRKVDRRITAPEDVRFRGRELVEQGRQATRLRREGKIEDAESIESSMRNKKPDITKLSAEYKRLYDELATAAIRVELARKGGTAQEVTEAENAYDTTAEQLKAFYDIEGGYTKAEAIGQAARRYSPKARRETIRAAAQARDERRAKKDQAEEDALGAVRSAREYRSQKMDAGSRIRDERINARGDEPREEVKLQRIRQAEEVSVKTAAALEQKVKGKPLTPEGQRLLDNLFMYLSPSVARDLDQIMDQNGKADSEKARTAMANALIEINQLMMQWLSDYRLALRQQTPADADEGVKRRNWVAYTQATRLTETLGGIRSFQTGDVSIADNAARYVARRISNLVVKGKRFGIGAEMDIDGFWAAIEKGPMAFRDYLSATVQSREDLSFPTNLTLDDLHKVSLGTLNALYVKALERLDGSRESDGQRKEMVKAIKKAAADRGLKLSDKPEVVKVRMWDRKKHEYVVVPRTISPRKLFAETFRRSYGVRGADSRMSMDQLKDLYLKGEFYERVPMAQFGIDDAESVEGMKKLKSLLKAGEIESITPRRDYRRGEDGKPSDGVTLRRKVSSITVWEDGYVTFNSDEHPNPSKAKGKGTKIELKPLGKTLPEPLPLSVLARRTTPKEKRKAIMAAMRAEGKNYFGGKSKSEGLTRTANGSRVGTRYSTGVLLHDTAPRSLGKRAGEYAEKKAMAQSELDDALSHTEKFLTHAQTAKFVKAAGDAQAALHARAYLRWVYEYGTALSKANLKSWAAIAEMRRVAEDLTEFAGMQPAELVAATEARFKAETNEQVFRAVQLDPVNLKGLTDPEKREATRKADFDKLRRTIVFHKRLTEQWQNHPLFLQDIQPVLNVISDSILRDGWPSMTRLERVGDTVRRVPAITAEQRETVKKLLAEWKGAKDLPLMQRGKLYQAWGFPAGPGAKGEGERVVNLYDDFYTPLNAMLEDAGFFDPDKALMKRYSRRFTTFEDQSTGPVAVIIEGENWKGQQETARRFASIDAPDPVALAAAELEQRKQEMRDRELAAMDDMEALDLNPGDLERRRKLISSPLGKTATTARKLLRANEVMSRFSRVLENKASTIRQVTAAENQMIENLKELGLWTDTGEATGDIGVPSADALMTQLEGELADLKKAQAKLPTDEGDTFATRSLTGTKQAGKVTDLAEKVQETVEALEVVRAARLGAGKAKTIAYRRVGDRLADGEITLEAARLAAGSKLAGLWVSKAKAERLGMDRAKTVSERLKERAKEKATEQKRRTKMTPEQVKLAEALDRRGVPMALPQVAGGGRVATNAEARAAIELRELIKDSWARVRNSNGTEGWHVLKALRDTLGENHFYSPLIRAMQSMPEVMKMTVDMQDNLGSSGMFFREQNASETGGVHVRQSVVIDRTSVDDLGHNELLHTVMHEFVHAASMQTLTMGNPDITAAWEELRQSTWQALRNSPDYGKFDGAFGNLYEFVAEVFSNPDLQSAMKNTKVNGVVKTLWRKLISILRRIFQMEPEFSSLLDVAASLQGQTLGGDPFTQQGQQKYLSGYKGRTTAVNDYYADVGVPFPDSVARQAVAPLMNSALMQRKEAQELMQQAASLGNRAKEGGQNFLLKALSMRQLQQFYSRFFGSTNNPLNKYMDAFEQRNSYASTLLEEADKLSRRWTAIEEGKKDEGVELSRIMHDATVQGVHADEAGSALNDRFRALSPAAQQLYRDVRDYYKITQKREVQLMLANALRSSKLWKGGEIEAEEIDLEGITKGDWLQQKLGIDLKAQEARLRADAKVLDSKAYKAREADFENTKEELRLIARMANIPMMNEGPYFPLMRFGDYAVKAARVVKTEVFATRKERAEAMERWSEKDPTYQFNFPPTDDETFPLTVSEVEFRLAETHAEAAEARKDLVEMYGDENVTRVQLKRNLINEGATIESNRALQTLLGKLDGNAAAQAALREFYIKSLSDRSFRKREAKRKNIRGADPAKQHRTFGAYSKSASYYTSQLKYGHIMADAKAEMQKVVEAHRDESEISAVRLGQIRNEIVIRDDQAATLTEVSPIVRGAVEAGQLWLLLSPSYWMINATQPYMVTIPWLTGRSNLATATKAIADAQALIISPLVQQGIDSWGGLKAIKSRLAAEKAFSVLENVEGTIREKLGKDAQPVLDMLTALKRESIIDLSFVAELRDIAEGQDKSPWGKVMDASRVLAHLTEVNNRIMTAIAAYNIAKGQGLDQKNATDFAKRAVAETQFDYSAANKPRLFSANDAWWKPLVFQFMQYVQHMYVLFFRHASMWWNAPRGSKEAQIGRRVVVGLLLTHMAAGGLLGATPQIAKWALGLAMMLFGAGDDEDRTFKNWASGEYYNRMVADGTSWLLGDGKAAETVRAGLPRLAGFDLSSRVAFLQTYMIDLDTKTSETLYGSLVSTFGGPMFGIAGNAFDAFEHIAKGDADKALEKLIPKLGRDAVRAHRFWREGMVDHTGKTIVGANDMSAWEIFLTGMGFQPSQIAETYARNNRAREAESFVSREKARIMGAYRMARSTGEINSVMADLREYNSRFPQDRITISQLLRGMRDMQKAERNIQQYGVDAGRRSAQYADDSYNVE